MSTDSEGTRSGAIPEPTEAERYPHLGTRGVSVSSSASADVTIHPSRSEGWIVATALLVAGCISMGIYLIVLHR
ncbi:MAG TPA: hypothetical protein VMV12_08570 [Candidatus Micrarchaeaceae archaeon]|nr:hypothetical protein [Candidatus Micrarchaeaceae archaeon]